MSHTDIKHEGWITNLPLGWQPYAILMRLDRPIGWWLLLLPGWWSIVLGAGQLNEAGGDVMRLMIYFFIGAVLMRGAGCIINDMWDCDLDKSVARTANRPLASGQIQIWQAGILLFFLLFISFIILLQTSLVTIGLGILSLFFVATYPYMKRITWWPQAFLGMTFNFGALMGWAAITHSLSLTPLMLYVAAFFWTLGYDTIYAHQDKDDDALVGIKSTARLFGDHSKIWVSIFYILTLIFTGLSVLSMDVEPIWLAIFILPACHLVWQIMRWDMDDPESSLMIFKSNRDLGLIMMACFIAITFLSPHIGFSGVALQ